MQKIIFVNRFFYPDQSATSQILSDLVFNIKESINAEIHIVTSRSTYENNKVLASDEVENGVVIHRVWTSRFGRSNLVGRLLDYLSFYISTFFMLMKVTSRNNIIIAKTDPPVISYVAYLVCKFKKARLINWLQDLFPEVAGELNLINKNSLLFYALKKLKNNALDAAEINVVIGDKMSNLVESQGVDAQNIKVIRNWSVSDRIHYVQKSENYLINKWGLKDKFVISYSGNFGRAHEYEPIKRLITELDDNDTVFLFIGGGKYYEDIKEYAESVGLKNVLFKPYQDKKELNYSLSVADIHIVSLIPSLEGLIVPSKFYGIASVGVPVLFIGEKDGEIGKVVSDKKCGYVISPEDYENIAAHVREIKNQQMLLTSMSSNISKLYDEEYQPDVAYNKWLDILLEYSQ